MGLFQFVFGRGYNLVRLGLLLILAGFGALPIWSPAAWAVEQAPLGIVLMHGKNGSPSSHIANLAGSLERAGYLVM